MKIYNINTKSNYSLLKSCLTIEKIINNATKNSQSHVFLADNNLYGSIEFIKAAKKVNLIPIVGLEIIYQNQLILMFPKTEKGYKNIIKISSFTLQNITYDINDLTEDVLFFVNEKLNFQIKSDDLYEEYSKELAINQANYLFEDENKVIQVMNAIKEENKIDPLDLTSSNELMLLDSEAFNQKYSSEQIEKTINIMEEITWNFEISKSEILKFNNNSTQQNELMIREICINNLLELLEVYSLPIEYIERLDYEISVISRKGFNDYFLIVHDFIAEAHNRGILVGPGRGSAAGSLVAYGLKITMVNPLQYNLIFERFLNPNRSSMPDIDIDIMDTRRDELIEYIFEKYGYEKVAHIITFQRMKAKMALRDVGRVFGIDLKIVNRISKLISSDYENDILGAVKSKKELKAFYDENPNLFEISQKLIGSPRQTGKHAAGIVLSEKNLIDVIPIQYESNNTTTTQISMDYLEELGLIKIDLLGLSNLTIIEKVMKLIKYGSKISFDLRKIPLDNSKVYDAISAAKTFGIFQLESPGMRKTLSSVKPRNIEDISIVSALFRPGPQENIKSFVARREGREPIEFIDQRIGKIVKDTNGIIIYQEQVIEIVQVVANFSAADAEIFRKAISKKQEDKMAELKEDFIDGGIKNGYSEHHIAKIFEYIEKFALYGFNHSHSISYALISYWMMFFKIYYPIEFYSVALSTLEGSHDKIATYCNEIMELGIGLEQPNINLSKRNFIILNKKIFFGFSSIKGIGNETSKKIINTREQFGPFKTYEHAVANLLNFGVGEGTLQILIKSGCFDEFNHRKFCLENLKEVIVVAKNLKEDGNFLFEPRLKDFEISLDEQLELNQDQLNLIGFNFSKEDKIPATIFEEYKKINLKTLNTLAEGTSKVILKIIKIRACKTKLNKEMAFIYVEDNTKSEQLACFSYAWIKETIKENAYYIATIKKQERGNQLIAVERVYE